MVILTDNFTAAVRSSSAASDPITEKLECFLDHRSLLGMLQQRAHPQEDPTSLRDPRQPLVLALCPAQYPCRVHVLYLCNTTAIPLDCSTAVLLLQLPLSPL